MSETEFESMGENFENLAAHEVAEAPHTAATTAKKARLDDMKRKLNETMSEDPDFVRRLHTKSNDIEVVNSLGFGEGGNIRVDTNAAERTLVQTSVIVGYRIHNLGAEPITYVSENWTKDAEGKWVPQTVEKVLAPDGYADLTRQFMTRLCSSPEISFQLKNGKIIRGCGNKGHNDTRAELEAYYFAFNKDLGLAINSDEVKKQVGEKTAEGKWVVKPEFEETFGYLNNAPEKSHGKKRGSSSKFSAADLAANAIQRMLAKDEL